jgi:hypothetical protein
MAHHGRRAVGVGHGVREQPPAAAAPVVRSHSASEPVSTASVGASVVHGVRSAQHTRGPRGARPPRCLPHPAAGRARRPMMSCGPARAAAPGLDFARAVAWPRQRTRPSSCTHGRLRERGRVGHHHDGHIMVLTGKKTARPGARGARGAAAGLQRATYGPWRRPRAAAVPPGVGGLTWGGGVGGGALFGGHP